MTIERDIEILSIVILLIMLFILNYYGLTLDPLQKWIALGICFFCVVDVVNSSVLLNLFNGYFPAWMKMQPQIERVNELWSKVAGGQPPARNRTSSSEP